MGVKNLNFMYIYYCLLIIIMLLKKFMRTRLKFIIVISIFALFITSLLTIGIIEKTKAEAITKTNTLSIGTIDVDAVKQIMKHQPTADYIASKLSNETVQYKAKVIIPQTVDDMINILKQQRIDLYFDSPFTIALVDKETAAVPFLLRWKEGVAQYHSVFIVKKNSPISTLKDFTGKTIAFEAPESTSGYLLPKAYLLQKGFSLIGEPTESYLAQREFGSAGIGEASNSSSGGKPSGNTSDHNNTDITIRYVFAREDQNIPLWIVEGKADIGVISNIDLEQQTPKAIKSQLKVVDRTIDVPRHVVSHRSGLDPSLVEKIKHILLDMDKDPEGIKILRNFENTTKYEEIKDKEEKILSNINDMLPLLLEQKKVER
jgi:phosphonate transport system substrate-binding protein